MTAIIGFALTLVSAGTSLTSALPSVVPQTLLMVIVLVAEVAMGSAAIQEFRKVNHKVAALTRGRPSAPSPGGAGTGLEAPLAGVDGHPGTDRVLGAS